MFLCSFFSFSYPLFVFHQKSEKREVRFRVCERWRCGTSWRRWAWRTQGRACGRASSSGCCGRGRRGRARAVPRGRVRAAGVPRARRAPRGARGRPRQLRHRRRPPRRRRHVQRILGIQYVACIALFFCVSFDVAAAVATDRQWGCARCAVPWDILPTRPLSLHCSTGLLMQTSNLTNHRCNINNFWKQLQGKVPGDDSCSTACAHEP